MEGQSFGCNSAALSCIRSRLMQVVIAAQTTQRRSTSGPLLAGLAWACQFNCKHTGRHAVALAELNGPSSGHEQRIDGYGRWAHACVAPSLLIAY